MILSTAAFSKSNGDVKRRFPKVPPLERNQIIQKTQNNEI